VNRDRQVWYASVECEATWIARLRTTDWRRSTANDGRTRMWPAARASWLPAREAVRRGGMADQTGTLEDALAVAAQAPVRRQSSKNAQAASDADYRQTRIAIAKRRQRFVPPNVAA